MTLRALLTLVVFSSVNANAEMISGFEPVWKEKSAISNIVEEKYPSKAPVTKSYQSWKNDLLVPGQKKVEPLTGMEFVWVPGGCFQMGCESGRMASVYQSPADISDMPLWQWPLAVVAAILPVGCAKTPREKRKGHFQSTVRSTGCYPNEQPVHEVCVDGFWMGKYEVTQGQFKKITDKTVEDLYDEVINSDKGSKKYWEKQKEDTLRYSQGKDKPVFFVSRNDAQTFIHKLNSLTSKSFRLPTEAEWEYAARNGGKEVDYTGTRKKTDRFKPNKLGIHNMLIDYEELCWDRYSDDYYSRSPRDNPQGPTTGNVYVTRGKHPPSMKYNRKRFKYGLISLFRGEFGHYDIGTSPDYRSRSYSFRIVLSGDW